MPCVVVLDVVGSNRSLGLACACRSRTAPRYSNLSALRLPLVDIHIPSRLHRLTAISGVPVVCIQVVWPRFHVAPALGTAQLGTGQPDTALHRAAFAELGKAPG